MHGIKCCGPPRIVSGESAVLHARDRGVSDHNRAEIRPETVVSLRVADGHTDELEHAFVYVDRRAAAIQEVRRRRRAAS